VDGDLVSGTLIVDDEYSAFGYGNIMTDAVTSGPPVTTTVMEVGLIDSYKEVTPVLSLPGGRPADLYRAHRQLRPHPTLGRDGRGQSALEDSTYQRDAVIGAGQLLSDIVSIHWTGTWRPSPNR